MSHRKCGISFSAASGDEPTKGNTPDNGSEHGSEHTSMLGKMSMAVPNEYSDLEYDEGTSDENEKTDKLSSPNLSGSHFSSNFSKSAMPKGSQQKQGSSSVSQTSMLNQYGIGAKLIMQMGYKEGKGLGSKQNGIAVPIETKLRPQGLGVGGIREKNSVSEDIISSDEDNNHDSVQATVSFLKPTYDLFSLIDALEKGGVKVPLYYKDLSDDASSGTLDSVEVETAYSKLLKVSAGLSLIDLKMGNLNLEVGHIDRSLIAERIEKSTLSLLIEKIDALDASMDLSSTTLFLEEISRVPFCTLPQIQEVFVAYAKRHVITLFASINEQSFHVLLHWAALYRNFTPAHVNSSTISSWDSLILHLLKENGGAAYNIRFWLDSPVVIDSPLVEYYGLRQIVLPTLMKKIHNWDLKLDLYTGILESLSDIEWSDSDRRLIVETVADRYATWCSRLWQVMASQPGTFYECFKHEMSPVLEHFCLTGSILIAQYNERKMNDLKKEMTTNLVHFCQNSEKFENSEATILKVVLEFEHSFGLISHLQLEMIMQFTVLNRMAKKFQKMLQNQESPLSLFHHWQGQFMALTRSYPDVENLLMWYTNAFIACMKGYRAGIGTEIAFPAYNQALLPNQELESLVFDENGSGSDVYALASLDLLATFKDVVQQVCMQHNVLFRGAGRTDPRMNQIYELKFPNGDEYECYLSNDVLWVRNSVEFSPVDLLQFVESHR